MTAAAVSPNGSNRSTRAPVHVVHPDHEEPTLALATA
jgi:hypothetical protein